MPPRLDVARLVEREPGQNGVGGGDRFELEVRAGTHVLQPVVHDVDQPASRSVRATRILRRQQLVPVVVQVVPGILATHAEFAAPRRHLRQRIQLARPDPFRLHVVEESSEGRRTPPARQQGFRRFFRFDRGQLVAGSRIAKRPDPFLRRVPPSEVPGWPLDLFDAVFPGPREGAPKGGGTRHAPTQIAYLHLARQQLVENGLGLAVRAEACKRLPGQLARNRARAK